MASAIIPLIVITGPTASGKTAAALRLAAEFGGEIIAADSRTVYKGLDIGTAKPTAEEQALVPHHLLDVVNPDESYTLADFQQAAQRAIADIRERGKIPFLVGGSGLYVDSVVLNYELNAPPDSVRRAELEQLSLDDLLRYSTTHNIEIPNNSHNKRYVIRAIEQGGVNRQRQAQPDKATVVLGIETDTDSLKERILQRSEAMINSSVVDETTRAAARYGWDIPALRAPAYRAVRRLLSNEITVDEAARAIASGDWQLARKQRTWMRRNDWITWLPLRDVEPYVRSILTQR